MKDNQDLWSSIILEVMILDTLNPVTGFSVNLLSLMTLRHLASEKPFWIWTSLQHSKGRVGRTCASLYPCPYLSGLRKKDCFSTLTFGNDMLQMHLPSYRLRVISPSSCWEYFDTHIQLWWNDKSSSNHRILSGVTWVMTSSFAPIQRYFCNSPVFLAEDNSTDRPSHLVCYVYLVIRDTWELQILKKDMI